MHSWVFLLVTHMVHISKQQKKILLIISRSALKKVGFYLHSKNVYKMNEIHVELTSQFLFSCLKKNLKKIVENIK